jgi:hypothetical protein
MIIAWDICSQVKGIPNQRSAVPIRPEPSLGSHFFHNLTATNMGYFHIQYDNEAEGTFDWDWLLNQPILRQTKYVKLIRRQEAFKAKIDGRSFKGIIYK